MKMIFYSLLVLVSATVLQVHAGPAGGSGGYDHGNGGDMCENRFKTVREEIRAWIVKGGSKDLRLPNGVSHEQYTQVMLEKMQTAKVSCIEKPVIVRGAEKTCKNFVETDGSLSIHCNSDRFMNTSSSNQIILVHHEYAGLAGFEVNKDKESNYEISNQIINRLVGIRMTSVKLVMEFIVKVVKMSEVAPNDRAKKNNSICLFIGRVNEGEIVQELYRELASLSLPSSDSDRFPDNAKKFGKLRINIMGLKNYCIENQFPEDPNPIGFEDAPGLLARALEIQQQLADIAAYLEQRFPSNTK